MKTPVPRHRLVQLLLMFLLFLGSSVGSWAWFHVSPQKYPVSYHFHVRQQVAGYEFVPEAVAEEAVEILATTNLFNGRFVREKRDRFTVFAGEWTGRDAREMSVVQHTPDICWVTVGARPVDMGQPSVVEVPLAGEKVAFECRVFNMGHDSIPEMTIWCATATGQVLMDGGRIIRRQRCDRPPRPTRLTDRPSRESADGWWSHRPIRNWHSFPSPRGDLPGRWPGNATSPLR